MQTTHIFPVRRGKLAARLEVKPAARKIEGDIVPPKKAKPHMRRTARIPDKRRMQMVIIKIPDFQLPDNTNLALRHLIGGVGNGRRNQVAKVAGKRVAPLLLI